jgi:hypothetical protein
VSADQSAETVPARVVEAYDQMMRGVVGPALRQLGFTGTVREFRYGSRSQFGAVAWQKSGRDVVRGQILRFTANVRYVCGADRIGGLMPVPAQDTWWEMTGGQSYGAVAESVIAAVSWYALPAIQAGLEDPGRPDVDWRWSRAFSPGNPDDGGAAASSVFVQPAGTGDDDVFTWFTSGDPQMRLDAAEIVTARAPGDPRTVAALVDRLGNDPNPMVRKLIASRMLAVLAGHPGVISAMETAATDDHDTGVRWAARYALRLAAYRPQS